MEVVAEAANGAEAIARAGSRAPDVAVLDMAMPELDGLQAIHEIVRRAPQTKILVLSMYDEPRYVRNACGPRARLPAQERPGRWLGRGRARRGRRQALPERLASGDRARGRAVGGSAGAANNRERQILQLITQARTNKEIARVLDISVNTVNVHRANLMKTLNLHSTAELVLFGVRHGLAPAAEQ